MAIGGIPVPLNHPVIDSRTGLITRHWSEYFLALANGTDSSLTGYMAKATYDPTNSGSVVDSDKLGGVPAASYALATDAGLGRNYFVQATSFSPADATTYYFGQLPQTPGTTAGNSKVYVRKAGTITTVNLYTYAGTAGTSEDWAIYLSVNGTDDYLISTVSAAASERVFSNTSLGIPVSAGDYFEIKTTTPTWATNPASVVAAGYVTIE